MDNPNSTERKVFWISYPFPPAVSAGVFRSARFLKYLGQFGWRPAVFTVEPDEKKVLTDQSLETLIPDQIEVHAAPMWRPDQWSSKWLGWMKPRRQKTSELESRRPNTGISKQRVDQPQGLLPELRQRILATPDPKIWWARPAFGKALRILRRSQFDAIFSTAPPHSSHLLGLWLKRRIGIPLVLDFRDPWTRSPWATTHSPYIERVNQQMERECVENADAVILNTEAARREFQEFYGTEHAGKFHAIYNGFDPELESVVRTLAIRPHGITRAARTFTIRHVGTIYGRRDIRPFFQAIAELNQRLEIDLRFEQVGLVQVDYDLSQLARELGLADNVSIEPPVTHQQALEKMAGADSLLLLQPDGNLQVPGKLFEMILFRKPILTLTGDGATRDLATRYRLGPIAPADDVHQIAAALLDLSGATTFQTDWNQVLSEFNGRNQTQQLAQILDHVAAES